MSGTFTPPYCALDAVDAQLREAGFAVLPPTAVQQCLGCDDACLASLLPYWARLPLDTWLKDGGRYRRRRHSCFVIEAGAIRQVAHRAHWQPVEYNALHGGMQRWFEPIEPGLLQHPAWARLLHALAGWADALRGPQRWHVEAHPFRIDTTDGIGRPTPEGAHRDGVDLVAVLLLARHQIQGGETRIFAANGPQGLRFTLSEPWTLLLLDDAKVIHESTPIRPIGEAGHRDTLVITLRGGGFQGEG